MDRGTFATGAVVIGGTLTGFVLSVFVFESDQPLVAGLLGTGGGAMIGSFIAAIANNEPLLGSPTDMSQRRPPSRNAPPSTTAAMANDRDESKAL